jgi:hypothetical protein
MKMTYTEKVGGIYSALIAYAALYNALDGNLWGYIITIGLSLVVALLLAILPRYK